ncbi:hypothetical protein ACHAXN_002524 [Cyclotella atomus]
MDSIRERADEGNQESIKWVDNHYQRLEDCREKMKKIRERAARAKLEAADPEIQAMKSEEEKKKDDEAINSVKKSLSGLAKASDASKNAARKKAIARVHEFYSQGRLSLADNGVVRCRVGEEDLSFCGNNAKQLGIGGHYKVAREEALKLVRDPKPPAAAKLNVLDDGDKKPRPKKKAASVPKKKFAAFNSDSDDDNKKPRPKKKAASVPKKKAASVPKKSAAQTSNDSSLVAFNVSSLRAINDKITNDNYWTCGSCTYPNAEDTRICAMCALKRGN